jgi:hypothetical protein
MTIWILKKRVVSMTVYSRYKSGKTTIEIRVNCPKIKKMSLNWLANQRQEFILDVLKKLIAETNLIISNLFCNEVLLLVKEQIYPLIIILEKKYQDSILLDSKTLIKADLNFTDTENKTQLLE